MQEKDHSPGNPDKERENLEESFYGQSREEDFAKRDRVLNRLMNAESPRDVAAAIEMVKDYEGVHYGGTIDRYTYSAYKKAALEGKRAFEKGSKDISDLAKDGIVEGSVNAAGFLENGGKVKAAGYAIRVDRKEIEEPHILQKVVHNVDPKTGERGTSQLIEETVRAKKIVESVYFGSADERLALSRAHEELHKILVTSEILQNQTILFDETRASLESMVKSFYQGQVYFTNLQTGWFFSAADISKMDHKKTETLYNTELGDRRDKAMRLYHLVGMCEQRENFEKYLNETYNLEEILDYDQEGTETIDRVLQIAKNKGKLIPSDNADKDEKYIAAVKFLIGKDVKINRDANGNWQYSLDGWTNWQERDPVVYQQGLKEFDDRKKLSPDKSKSIEEEKNQFKENFGKKIGGKCVDYEKNQRGFLTEFGNPYAEAYRDNLYALMSRMNEIVGDDMAVSEAGRFFWTRGLRDELGVEIYAHKIDLKTGELVENLPTGEELLSKYNSSTFEEWEKYCQDMEKRYAINGEPVASDLSKVFWPKMWRLKEMMKDRSAGPYLTYDSFDRLTQSELSLCRVKIETGEKDDFGEPILEMRSIREVWLGYKGAGKFASEHAIDLGKISWEQAKPPGDVKNTATTEATEVDKKGIQDNADGYFWVMNYLAGDDNPAKRPYQFIMKGVERFGDLQKPEAYTDKIKFWKIVWHGPAITWGNWRKLYQKNKITDKDYVTKTEDEANAEAARMLDKGKKDWWKGVASMPDYPLAITQRISYMTEGGSTAEMKLSEFIERLATKYGFIDPEVKGKAVGYIKRLKITPN